MLAAVLRVAISGLPGRSGREYFYLTFENVLATAHQTIEIVADMAHVTIENVIIICDHRVRDHFDYDNRTRCLKSI